MKTLIVTMCAFVALAGAPINQDDYSIIAVFDGFEDGIYIFSDEDGNSFEFEAIKESASEKYDLKQELFKGKSFKISYEIDTKVDDFDDEYEVWVIVGLKLIE